MLENSEVPKTKTLEPHMSHPFWPLNANVALRGNIKQIGKY